MASFATRKPIKYTFVSVTQTINTGIDAIHSITLLSRNTAVISGAADGIQKVKSYNLQTGAELSCLNLKDAYGVVGMKLGGKLVLAVARRLVKRFHKSNHIFSSKYECYMN